MNRKLIFVPIPIPLLYVACRLFEMVRIKVPVSSESVLGLKKLITLDTRNDQEILDIKFEGYRESLDKIIKQNEL
ncbi:hypothetical protein AB832_00855 [Flavobacteriaceae bacterium (ex Bugula neritina AB1)]|nr:hypothetical protein AB832_00855 [Flavobacteriaceae bacterium (ex Bugula neritina AB1)]